MLSQNKLSDFWSDQSGAVTVDYVVLSGAVAGMGIAATTTLSGGVDDLSSRIATALSGTEPQAGSELAFDDFSNGSAGWTGGQVRSVDGFGELLVLGSGEMVTKAIDIPEGTTQVTFAFDVASGDTVDLETAFFHLNGQLITHLNSQSRPVTSEETNLAFLGNDGGTPQGFSARYETVRINENIGGDPYWKDSITRVYLTMDNPPPQVNFAMSNNLNEGFENEFYGLDNFTVTTQ